MTKAMFAFPSVDAWFSVRGSGLYPEGLLPLVTLASSVQAPSCCVLAGSDRVPAGFGRRSGCQATQCLLGTG